MTAPLGWQKGSFRGVSFVTGEHTLSGGRRGVLHELPQRDTPIWEDLGRRAQAYTLVCHIRGRDHLDQANRFCVALDARGTGTLVHPWLGSMLVAVETYSRRDSTSEGGYTEFEIDFTESGLAAATGPSPDTRTLAKSAATVAAVEVPARFATAFSLDRATAFVESATAAVVQLAGLAFASQAEIHGLGGLQLFDLQRALGLLVAPGSIIRSPLALTAAVLNVTRLLSSSAPSASARIAALEAMTRWGAAADANASVADGVDVMALPAVAPVTPARAQQAANQMAIVELVNLAAALELTQALSETPFSSYDEAVAIRDRVADRLDVLALRQADAGDDRGAHAYDDLRRAIVRDITSRGGALTRLQAFVPAGTEPALVIAFRLYGEPDSVAADAAELVQRNGVRHPGFVQGGRALQVLTPAVAYARG